MHQGHVEVVRLLLDARAETDAAKTHDDGWTALTMACDQGPALRGHAHVHVHTHIQYIHICIYIYIYSHTYLYVGKYMHIPAHCVNPCISIYLCLYIYTYLFSYRHICTFSVEECMRVCIQMPGHLTKITHVLYCLRGCDVSCLRLRVLWNT